MSWSQSCDSARVCTCDGEDRSPAGLMFGHHHASNSWMVSYRFMFMDMNQLAQGRQGITSETAFNTYLMAPTTMQMQMHMLMVMYGISPSFTVMGMANFVGQTMDMEMYAMAMHHHEDMVGTGDMLTMNSASLGFSDTRFMLLYHAYDDMRSRIVPSLGISIPTGSIGKRDEAMAVYFNSRMPYMMQLGTGTVDIQPGLTYLFDTENWSAGAQAYYTIRPYKNKWGYRWGNELEVNVWAGRQIWNWLSLNIRSQTLASGTIKGMDSGLYAYQEPGTNPINYGGFRSNLFGGVNFHLPQKLLPKQKFGVEFGGPVYQNNNGIQLRNKWGINASWTITF